MANIVERLMLVTLDEKGTWVGGGTGPDEALGAASLAELVMDGIVTIHEDKFERVEVAGLNDGSAAYVQVGLSVADSIPALGALEKNRQLARLGERGIIAVSRKRIMGLIPAAQIDVRDNAPRRRELAALEAYAEQGDNARDSDVGIVVSILHAASLLEFVRELSPRQRKKLASLADDGSALSQAAGHAVDQLRSVIFTTVLLPAAFRGA